MTTATVTVMKAIDRVVTAALVACLLVIALMFYWAQLDRTSPMAVLDDQGRFSASPNEDYLDFVTPGQHVYHIRKVCIDRWSPLSIITREFPQMIPVFEGTRLLRGVERSRIVDGFLVFLPDKFFDVNAGCYTLVTPLKIPSNLADGEYVYRNSIEFYRNPLQLLTGGVIVEGRPITFEVRKP